MSKNSVHTVYKSKDGKRLPSVTTILGILNKPALLKWAWQCGIDDIDYLKARDSAADAGTLAHSMILAHLKGEKSDTTEYSKEIIDLAENSFLSYLEWERGKKLEPVLIETPLVSECGYGGTMDFYGKVDDVLTLVDFKTGKGIYDEYIIQVSAYDRLLTDNQYPPAKSWRILRIGRDANDNYEEKVIKDIAPAWAIFQHCLSIYRLQKEMKGEK